MSFFQHLDELRGRIFRGLIIFFIGFVLSYVFLKDEVLEFLRVPLYENFPPEQRKLYFTSLFENFLTHLKIAGYTSVFALAPYFFYELWGFIAPGLYPREKKMVVPFVLMATLFFAGGTAFAYYVLFPVGFKFFVHYGLSSDVPLLTIDSYYSTCMKLLLLFGLAFEFPVVIVLLGALGVVDAAFLRKNRRTAILGITIASALFAPPDAISMILMMIPLIFLYEGAIWVVQWLGVRRRSAQAEEPGSALVGRSR